MTRHRPPAQLNCDAAVQAQRLVVDRAVGDIFRGAPAWQIHCALAAVYRMRPQLGVEADLELHAFHMLVWHRAEHSDYFFRLCKLMKFYGIGTDLGDGW